MNCAVEVMSNETQAAQLDKSSSVLVILDEDPRSFPDCVDTFFGAVEKDVSQLEPEALRGKTIYLCGDIGKLATDLRGADRVFLVRQASRNYVEAKSPFPVVDQGRLPIFVHGVGVLYRQFFDDESSNGNLFHLISHHHSFQRLTESDKPGRAYRTGAYLTRVQHDEDNDDLHFNLLRCSSNLSGPTLNFAETDRAIVDLLNQEAGCIFQNHAPLNHVLAQVYHNVPAQQGQEKKQVKAKIKAHADKTKDMPHDGIMAFCTFYEDLKQLQPMSHDSFDYGHRGLNGEIKCSGLTTLHFKLKKQVAKRPWCRWTDHFSVTLYPNSVFFMPLSTNRLYTHEIRPSVLDAALLPTRMGYVVRCSKTPAVFRQGKTHLVRAGGGAQQQLVPMEPPTPEGTSELRRLYFQENTSDTVVDYGSFLFSMNQGDYLRPVTYSEADDFRTLMLQANDNLFHHLQRGVSLEPICGGRLGAVLVQPDERGTPIVRTTTKYKLPAQTLGRAHEELAQQIKLAASLPDVLNNAMMEIYENSYAKMGFHSDQALDLQEGSHIAIFSCYEHPDAANPAPRKLVVESKDAAKVVFEIPLRRNGVVVFSTDTNKRFRHKIVLDHDSLSSDKQNRWLGLTFRTSKTFVRWRGEEALLEDGMPLTLADEAQRKEFFQLRGRENREVEFSYPQWAVTISESDLVAPVDRSTEGGTTDSGI